LVFAKVMAVDKKSRVMSIRMVTSFFWSFGLFLGLISL
jgi:hypothetical protein